MNRNLEELGRILSKYIDDINNLIIDNLRAQKDKVFQTNQGVYENVKIERGNIENFEIEDGDFHNLFSKDGCMISGAIFVRALAHDLKHGKEIYSTTKFKIVFNHTRIVFNFDSGSFELVDGININYITIADNLTL